MNLKICFILSVFCLGTLQAENLLQDLDVNTDLKFTTVKAFKYVKTIMIIHKAGQSHSGLVKERHFLAGGARGGQRPSRMRSIMTFIVGNRKNN